jgi:hypothetical protein
MREGERKLIRVEFRWEKPFVKRIFGLPRKRWEDNILMDLR